MSIISTIDVPAQFVSYLAIPLRSQSARFSGRLENEFSSHAWSSIFQR